MRRIHIGGGRVIDPASGLDRTTDVCVADGHILHVGEPPADFPADVRVDAKDCVVCPGLIDIAARLGEPGREHAATIASEARAAVAGGITTLVSPPDTEPVTDSTAVVELIHRRALDAAAARVLAAGALTRGLAGKQLTEMAALQQAGCPVVADGGQPIRNTLVLRRALEYAATFDLPVVLSPWDPWLGEAGCLHEGAVATRLGLPGVSVAAETAGLGRSLAVTAAVGGRAHLGRLSAAEGVALVRQAIRAGQPVSADTAVHQLFFSETDATGFDSRFHLQPPLRTTTDREALRRGVADGTIAILCSDHQPHGADAKHGPFATTEVGVCGLDTLLPLLLRLVDDEVLSLPDALATVTINPARLLGVASGQLIDGAPADICVFDPDTPWWVTPEALRSAGGNSPFLGWELTGRVTHTLVDGRVVHRNDEAL